MNASKHSSASPGHAARSLALAACLLALLTAAQAQQAGPPAVPATAPNLPPQVQPVNSSATNVPETGLPVIAVVHRLSGWRLRALLAWPDASLPAAAFDEQFVRTNVVAGYVLPDGRSVVARLSRAEAELLDLPAQVHSDEPKAAAPSLALVRGDGSEVNARFVGLDATTGLSLLEAAQFLASPVAARGPETPSIGQRVRVVAPVPVAPPPNPAAPVGDAGVIYMNMSEATGQLTEIKHSPTGKTTEVTVAVERVTPEWTGGVAFGETGTLVGIVAASDAQTAHLVSAETVRAAAARVQARQASVPQPWLGARGDAVALAPLAQFVARGWSLMAARALANRRQGVLLTDVAPGTPAALAGLRPGDVVARISQREVLSVADMSSLLQELGGNAAASFTVLRAQSAAPLNLTVQLSEARNPSLETAQAEARAAAAMSRRAASEARIAQAEQHVAESEARRLATELRACETTARLADAAHKAAAAQQVRATRARWHAAQARVAAAQAHVKAADVRAADARQRRSEADARIQAASVAPFSQPAPQLLLYGLQAIRSWPATNDSTQANLLVVSVRPQSAAARAGLQAGDVIETVDGQRINAASDDNASDAAASLTLGIMRNGQKLIVNLPREMKN